MPLWYRNKRSFQTRLLDFTDRWVMLNIPVSEPQGAMKTPLQLTLPSVHECKWSWGDEASTRRDFLLRFQQTELIRNLTLCPLVAKIHTEGQLARFPHFFTGRQGNNDLIFTSSVHFWSTKWKRQILSYFLILPRQMFEKKKTMQWLKKKMINASKWKKKLKEWTVLIGRSWCNCRIVCQI